MPRPIRNTTDISDGYFVFTLNHLLLLFTSSSLATVLASFCFFAKCCTISTKDTFDSVT
jgi:hypothetical protein